jgi:hypothetical protein
MAESNPFPPIRHKFFKKYDQNCGRNYHPTDSASSCLSHNDERFPTQLWPCKKNWSYDL